jgi:hypothetical protein
MIIKINAHKIDWIKLKTKKYYARSLILKILFENKYYLVLKINFISIKHKEIIDKVEQYLKKLNAYKIIKT